MHPTDDQPHLAQQLEQLSALAIAKLKQVLDLPVDTDNGPLLRAQTGAAMVALNTQLRADALRLRAAKQDKALDALIAIVQQQEALMMASERRKNTMGTLVEPVDGQAVV